MKKRPNKLAIKQVNSCVKCNEKSNLQICLKPFWTVQNYLGPTKGQAKEIEFNIVSNIYFLKCLKNVVVPLFSTFVVPTDQKRTVHLI